MLAYGLRYAITCGSASHSIQLDSDRGQGIPSTKDNAHVGTNSAAIGLDKAISHFVDALDIAIGSTLTQLTESNWYQLMYYSS